MEETPTPSPEWAGETRVEGLGPARFRERELKRDGNPYLTGNVWAYDAEGRRAARLTFEVHEASQMVLVGNAEADGTVGSAGDVQTAGAARAMMDKLDALYPPPDWWFAADRDADHTPDGLRLMRSRRKPGRQWVHTADCAERLPAGCSCEFPEPRPNDGGYEEG